MKDDWFNFSFYWLFLYCLMWQHITVPLFSEHGARESVKAGSVLRLNLAAVKRHGLLISALLSRKTTWLSWSWAICKLIHKIIFSAAGAPQRVREVTTVKHMAAPWENSVCSISSSWCFFVHPSRGISLHRLRVHIYALMCASCASQTNFLNHLRNEFDLRLSEMKSVRDEKRDEDKKKERSWISRY